MAYIGTQPSAGFTSMAKQVITGNGGANYTLDYAVANEQEIEVFVNNVRQEPSVAYTVSGTALTMTGNVASTDDFYVVYQGKAIQTSVPADDTITTAMLKDSSVTTAKIADNAVGTAQLAAAVALGITEFDSWRLTQDNTYNNGSTIDSYWERTDTEDFEKIGTGMSQSSGIFTFPSTGYWLIHFVAQAQRTTANTDGVGMGLQHTTDNSNWTTAVDIQQGVNQYQTSFTSGFHFVKISDTANDKVRFIMTTQAGSGTLFFGATDRLKTGAYFAKIAEI